jgi:S-DNA-T family DNA segregation ATPase FtsK/SpoIIIE
MTAPTQTWPQPTDSGRGGGLKTVVVSGERTSAPQPWPAGNGAAVRRSTPAVRLDDVDDESGRPALVDVDAVVAAPPVDARLVNDQPSRDRPPRARPTRASRRAVIPQWCRDPKAAMAAVRWAVGYYVHCAAYHLVRLPVYWLRLAARSPVGAFRMTNAVGRWVLDPHGRAVRQGLASMTEYEGRDGAVYLRLVEHRRQVVRTRCLLVAVTAAAAVAAIAVLSTPARLASAAVVLLGLLGLVGRSADKPVTSRAVDSAGVPRLTADLILTALGSLGLGEMNKALAKGGTAAVRFPAPITRDGPGFRADIDLPPGVTAGDVIERRDRLASGLRRPLGCVWPEVDTDAHAGRLVLWVGDRSLSSAKPVMWPLAKSGRVNVFEPVVIGADQRGRPVTVTLMYASGVEGAQPRMGKTFLLRLICLAAALDPRVQLHAYNLKGGSDFEPLAMVAHRYRAGDDSDDIEYLVRDLRSLSADMRRRYRTIRDLPKAACPESKVTDDLAGQRALHLHPVLVALDECQIAFEHDRHGAEITSLVTDLVKRGPAVGIMVWVATQRPDAKSLPTGISANAVLRICLKVQGQVENDMVLGTSAYKNGTRATMFGRKDRGIAILAGEVDDPQIVRAAYVDTPAAEAIATRARAARVGADLLTGHAAGVDADADADTTGVLEHLLAVWPDGDEKAWCDDLAERLAATYPGSYDGWTGEQVTASVRPHGLRTIQIKRTVDGRAVNKRGLARTAALDAVAAAESTRPRPLASIQPTGSQTRYR